MLKGGNKKSYESTRVNLLTPWPWTNDWDNPIKKDIKKKNYGDQFLLNQMLKDEMEIILKKNQSQPVLTFKTYDLNHKHETNFIEYKL
jgi:hypothetical protein